MLSSAAVMNLIVSELPSPSCQQQNTSNRCHNFQKAKTSKTILNAIIPTLLPLGGAGGGLFLAPPNLTRLFLLFLPDKGIT
jgi:hypothetical protein